MLLQEGERKGGASPITVTLHRFLGSLQRDVNFREKSLSTDQNKREGNLRQQELSELQQEGERNKRERKWLEQGKTEGKGGGNGVGVVRVAADK